MKKYVLTIIAVIMTGCFLCACASSDVSKTGGNDKIKIVTTIFPEYDWVMNILGDKASGADVKMLLDNGVDLHSYQPTVDDILAISDCDLFIYVGGESDGWIDDALRENTNSERVVINLLDVLGSNVKEEEIVEGMQGEEEEEEEGEGEEGPEYDEHVWLSLRDTALLVNRIAEEIEKIDPANAKSYEKNAADYIAGINALDGEYESVISGSPVKTLLFGDRFPFRYLVDDYGLSYYAAFVGCSAETEASFETIAFLSGKVDELDLQSVMTIEGNDHSIAEMIVQNTKNKDQKILTLDSMQSVTLNDVKGGASYLKIMQDNLEVLKEALGNGSDTGKVSDEDIPLSTTEGIDIDLTELSGTMVYSEVYNMMMYPEDYVGKVVKMDGIYSVYHDEQTDNDYFACIIMDATACCSQGIEFVLTDEYEYPKDYPSEGNDICVIGTFDTYKEGEALYCTLREAKLCDL